MSGLSEEESRRVRAAEPGRPQEAVPQEAVPQEAVPPAAVPRDPPPPLEANDQLVTGVFTAGWAIALVVLLIVRGSIPAGERWWVWTAVAGLGMGLFGFAYVPFLKRSRARQAQRRSGQPG